MTIAPTHPHIAIIGKMGSGKTTCAEMLERELRYSRGSFAARLKEVASLIWGDSARTDRQKLQDLGVAVRGIQEDAWVDALVAQLLVWRGPIAIDDCRFKNEYWALKHLGFKFIRVHCDEAIREDRLVRNGKLQSREQFKHISETDLDGIDADLDITNESDEQALSEAVFDAVATLKRKVI